MIETCVSLTEKRAVPERLLPRCGRRAIIACMANEKVVWVLGAGFSRSLGAPLLKTLLRPGRLTDIHAVYRPDEYKRLTGVYIETAPKLYSDGIEYHKLWEDPEGFLDFLDTAATPLKSGEPSAACRRICQAVQGYGDVFRTET